MESQHGRFEPTRFEDLTVTVDFHCHSACRFCIVQEGMNRFKGVAFERFTAAVDDNVEQRRYRRLTFTGGEVALEKRLFDFVDYARESGSFEHIRLQTNGRLMADRAFAKELVDAGIDEFFVSLHGPNAEVQDHISQRPGSFDEAWEGMQNLKALGATLLTNTVLCTPNVEHLSAIVETVAPLGPVRMEWWNYLPMEDFADERELLVPMATLMPALRSALDRAKELGIETTTKYVPRCLLGAHGATLDNGQPDVVIAEDFYEPYPRFSCLYEAKCEHSETCLGLTHSYIEKYGWERDRLVPEPRTTPWREPVDGFALASERAGDRGHAASERPHPQWRALVEGVAPEHDATLASLTLDRRRCIYRFELGESSVDVVLTARTSDGPALLRTESFDLHYRNIEGPDRDPLAALVRSVAEAVRDRDPGGMKLDERKGLIGVEALRRSARRKAEQRRAEEDQ